MAPLGSISASREKSTACFPMTIVWRDGFIWFRAARMLSENFGRFRDVPRNILQNVPRPAVRSGPWKLWDYRACIMKLSMILAAAAIPLAVGFSPDATAQKKYGPGVTDTEIRIGQTAPYSGPISSLSIFGRIEAAY